MNRSIYILTRAYSELYCKSLEELIEDSFNLSDLEIHDTFFSILINEEDLPYFFVSSVEKDYLNEQKVSWRLYRVNDKLIDYLLNLTDEKKEIEKWASHRYNQAFGRYSEEEREKLDLMFKQKAIDKYSIVLPKLKVMAERCKKENRHLYYIELSQQAPKI